MGKHIAPAAVAIIAMLLVVYVWRFDQDREMYRECLRLTEKAIDAARETRTFANTPYCRF